MECYLCGTENAPEADFCVRCDGQLLRIPEVAADPEPIEEIEELEVEEEDPRPRRRVRRKIIRSTEDRRLHDALGLSDDEDDDDDHDHAVEVPTVEISSVPYIGTSPGAYNVGGARTEGISRATVIGLVALALAVALLGYRTLTKTEAPPPEDDLAFSDSTLPLPPEEEEQISSWSQAEVAGKFGPAFVSVVLIDCDGSEVEDEVLSLGLTIDEHNVVYLPNEDVPLPDLVRIRGRTSAGVLAMANRHEFGLSVATTPTRLTRNIGIVDPPVGEPGLFISRDLETDTNLVTDDDVEAAAESIGVSVSTHGEPLAVFLGARELALATLEDIGTFEAAQDESIALPEKPTVCDRGKQIVKPEDVQVDPEADDDE